MKTPETPVDEAVEALRQRFCELQRYSFHLGGSGGVQRVPDRCGNWVEFDQVHALFDAEVAEFALSKLRAKRAIAAASGQSS